MFGFYEAKNQYTLWKFLIDKKFQNNGYGREALNQGIAFMKKTFSVKEIYTGVALGNDTAKHLYNSVGFNETGIVEDSMKEMKLVC